MELFATHIIEVIIAAVIGMFFSYTMWLQRRNILGVDTSIKELKNSINNEILRLSNKVTEDNHSADVRYMALINNHTERLNALSESVLETANRILEHKIEMMEKYVPAERIEKMHNETRLMLTDFIRENKEQRQKDEDHREKRWDTLTNEIRGLRERQNGSK